MQNDTVTSQILTVWDARNLSKSEAENIERISNSFNISTFRVIQILLEYRP